MGVPAMARALAITGCLALVLSACGDSATNDAQATPTAFASKVQTPVAQAQEAGINIHWLGERIEGVGNDFRISGNAAYGDIANQLPSFDLEYSQQGERTPMYVTTFPPEETYAHGLQYWLGNEGATSEPVELTGWSGEIVSVVDSNGDRNLIVFLHGQDAAVMVRAVTGEGSVSSPLSDPEQLLAIIEDNLQPFPE